MADRRRLLETGDYFNFVHAFQESDTRQLQFPVSDLSRKCENDDFFFFLRCHANQHPHFHKNKQLNFKKNLSLKASASEIMSHIKLLSVELM